LGGAEWHRRESKFMNYQAGMGTTCASRESGSSPRCSRPASNLSENRCRHPERNRGIPWKLSLRIHNRIPLLTLGMMT
jgi:hypothetical protein